MQVALFSPKSPQTLTELRELLLKERQIDDEQAFFQPVTPQEIKLPDLGITEEVFDSASQRIAQAIKNQEKVVVFGDYDADGLCASTIMWQFLHELGAQVVPFIPHRQKHGYGLNKRSVIDLLALKPELVVTVDNGIVAGEQIRHLIAQKIDVIVTDHHQALPDSDANSLKSSGALAVIHTTQLCGASVAWMCAREIGQRLTVKKKQTSTFDLEQWLADSLDLAGLATIADQVPLIGANRSFVVYGLKALQHAKRPGIRALCQVAALEPGTMTEWQVSFALAPRLNAMGRLGEATEALRLLCGSSVQYSLKRAQLLEQTNRDRQELSKDQLVLAQQLAQKQQEQPILIVASDQFHEGIIGLLAGRLVEEFHKPSVVISLSELIGKGSARSVSGCDITALLRQSQPFLLELGGHPMAAGFSVDRALLEKFQEDVFVHAQDLKISPTPEIAAVCSLPPSLINIETAQTLQEFAPFGAGNPQPLFLLPSIQVQAVKLIGKQKQHLKISTTLTSGEKFSVLHWNYAQAGTGLPQTSQIIDVVGTLEIETWREQSSLMCKAKQLALST